MSTNTLQIAADSLMQTSQLGKDSLNWWMIIAITELIIILVLLITRSNRHNERRIIKEQVKQEGEIDWGNTVGSMFGAEPLYRELIRKCHPDRFAPDEEKMRVANDISERIGKYKHDIRKLEELKEEATKKLNINF